MDEMAMLTNLAQAGGVANDNEWKELPDGARAIPDFPTDALPDKLAEFVRNVAGAYQAPEGMVVAFALGVASAAIVGRVDVAPDHVLSHYVEPAQLYIIVQGRSGDRKTAVLNIKKPLDEWLDEEREKAREQNRAKNARIRALKKEFDRTHNADQAVDIEDEIDKIEKSKVAEPEFLMGDSTVEAITTAMAAHNGRAAILHDEADILNVLSGKSYLRTGSAVNLLPVLAGYSNSATHGNRITRDEWHIPRSSLSICLGAQPQLLKNFMDNPSGMDRGLHGRFLFFLPESKIGTRMGRGMPLSSSLLAWWSETIRRMASIAREGPSKRIPFDQHAENAYLKFKDEIELRLVGDLGGDMESWGCKLVGNMVRLAGLLAMIDGLDQVDLAHWDYAANMAEHYLIPCAVSLFLGLDPYLSEDARKVLDKIRGLDNFSESELRIKKFRSFSPDAFSIALDCLAQNGYTRKAAIQPRYCGRGSYPSTLWEVNPALKKQATKMNEVEL